MAAGDFHRDDEDREGGGVHAAGPLTASAVDDAIETALSTIIGSVHCRADDGSPVSGDDPVAVEAHLAGDWTLQVVLTMTGPDARQLTGRLWGTDLVDDSTIDDCLGEVVNMITGVLKEWAPDPCQTISQPTRHRHVEPSPSADGSTATAAIRRRFTSSSVTGVVDVYWNPDTT